MKPMDADFLEFWGNLLLNAAKSQRASETLTAWMQQGSGALGEFSDLFQKAYGLAPPTQTSPANQKASDTWQQAMDNYQHAFAQFIQLLDVVPRSAHRALEKRYEALQKEMMQCKATVARLESQLNKRRADADQAAFSSEFTELVDKQARQFTQLIESYGKMVKDSKK